VLDRVLALKVLPLGRSGDLERRFVAEARICASLEHPAIVPVHELGWLPDGRAWFTMREVRGRTLGEVLGDRPPLRRTLEQLARVAEAVAFAHSRGVVHRDLKPTNVMIGEYGEVFVVDWGIAKVVGGPSGPTGAARGADPALTVDGSVLGTPVYMAPEQAFGDPDAIGPATDVWGLGAVLYEVLTGRPPLQGQDTYEVVARLSDPRLVVRRVSTPVPVDHALWEVCERCLRREAGRPVRPRRPGGRRPARVAGGRAEPRAGAG
jgi:serine/threonine protein kinase